MIAIVFFGLRQVLRDRAENRRAKKFLRDYNRIAAFVLLDEPRCRER